MMRGDCCAHEAVRPSRERDCKLSIAHRDSGISPSKQFDPIRKGTLKHQGQNSREVTYQEKDIVR